MAWNWNVSRKFYESVEEFVASDYNSEHVGRIQDGRAIIGRNYIEVGDNRTEVSLTFQKDEDILIFLKEIKWLKK